MDFAEFLVLGLILATAVGTGAAFGTIAFFRLERYRLALMQQAARIAELEARLAGPQSTQITSTTPAAAASPLAGSAPIAPRPASGPAATAPAVVAAVVVHPVVLPPPASPRPAPAAAKVAALAPTLKAPMIDAPPADATALPTRAPAHAEALIKPDAYGQVSGAGPPVHELIGLEGTDAEAPALEARAFETRSLETPAVETPAATPFAVDMMMVLWAAGAVIAVAIIALLVYANTQGKFGEVSQLLLGYIIGAGMIGAAEAMRRRNLVEPPADWQARHTPAILAAAGLFCAYAITYVGLERLLLLPPAAAIGLMGACALGGFGLSLRHGRALAWEALAMGFAAPALVGVIGASATAFFAYLFAITAAAFALTKHRSWRLFGWAAALGALAWAGVWVLVFMLPSGVSAAAGYLMALSVLGVAFAWEHAQEPVAFSRRLTLPWPLPAWVGVAMVAAASTLLVALSIKATGAGGAAVAALVALTALLAIVAAFREGFAPAPLFGATAALVAIAAWPPILFAYDARAFAGVAGAFGFAASIGGWVMMARNRAPGPGAILAALGPTAVLLIVYLRLGAAINMPVMWGGAALVLAAFNSFALDRISSAAGGASKASGATTAFAAAAAACAVMAGAFALDHVRLAAGIAVLLIPLGWLDRRLNIPALRFTGAGVGAITVALLSPIALMRAPVEPAPLVNSLAPTFLVAMISMWAGARLFAMGPAGYLARVTIFLRIALIALAIGFGWAEIRHLANDGVLNAPYTALWEVGAHSAFLLIVACMIAWRYGRLERPLLQWTEMIAFVVAVSHTAVAGLALLAPWWGATPASVRGPPLANEIAAAYLAPAALFALYGVLRAQIAPSLRAPAATAATIVCGLAWTLLETRHLFHPTLMPIATIVPLEHGAYSAGLIAASALILAFALRLGATSGGLVLRLVAAMLTAIGFLKALALDVGLIEGPVRYAAYALVAAAAVAALLGYHRYVFPRPPGVTNDPRASDANLLPPRP